MDRPEAAVTEFGHKRPPAVFYQGCNRTFISGEAGSGDQLFKERGDVRHEVIFVIRSSVWE